MPAIKSRKMEASSIAQLAFTPKDALRNVCATLNHPHEKTNADAAPMKPKNGAVS